MLGRADAVQHSACGLGLEQDAVLEQAQCDGHVRVRIGENRWVSRETARGFVLLSPTEEVLVAVEEATVRKEKDVHSINFWDKVPVGMVTV